MAHLKLDFFLILFFLGTAIPTYNLLQSHQSVLSQEDANNYEVLYLPNKTVLQLISFDYANVLSDILWFNTINYFGKHYASDRNYQWLAHMCDLVVSLDVNKRYVYEFCGTMLSWEADAPQMAIAVLSDAIKHFPSDWHLYYQRGFTYMYFLNDQARAREDFLRASSLPDAESIVKRLAARQMLDMSDPITALNFLDAMIQTASDPVQQKALKRRKKEVRYELAMRELERGISVFIARFGHVPSNLHELTSNGILKAIPADPYKGNYYLDPSNGEVKSTSGKKRLTRYMRR